MPPTWGPPENSDIELDGIWGANSAQRLQYFAATSRLLLCGCISLAGSILRHASISLDKIMAENILAISLRVTYFWVGVLRFLQKRLQFQSPV